MGRATSEKRRSVEGNETLLVTVTAAVNADDSNRGGNSWGDGNSADGGDG